ncbi:hypothetical protein GCM10028857_24940 [Salinarchaeum chitinilyticum]
MADVFGRMVADYHRDQLAGQPVYERSDGDESPAHCAWYFAGPEEWGPLERAAIDACDGGPDSDRSDDAHRSTRVLDAGCGPGRALGPLADRGHEVLGIDESPGAIAVAREWTGLPAIVGDLATLPLAGGVEAREADRLDAALFLGTHVGTGGTVAKLRSLLAELDRVLAPGGRIVADLYDPTAVESDALRAYLSDRWLESPDVGGSDDAGTDRGDEIATRQFRLRYDGENGRWRTLLMASPAALESIVAPTAWSVAEIERGEDTRYLFVLERD